MFDYARHVLVEMKMSLLLPLSSWCALNVGVNLATLAYRSPVDISRVYHGRSDVADHDAIRAELKGMLSEPVYYDDRSTGTQALLCQLDEHEYALCVRGTDGWRDLLIDAHFRHSAIPDGVGRAHSGMQLQQRRLMRLCADDIHARMHDTDATLTVVGHSCGSGIGIIAAHHLGRAYPGRVAVLGFGTPRIGDRAFADSLIETLSHDRICLVKHGRDPITQIPPFRGHYASPHTVLTGGATQHTPPHRWRLRDHDIEQYRLGVQALRRQGDDDAHDHRID
jgi:hypothetical protein